MKNLDPISSLMADKIIMRYKRNFILKEFFNWILLSLFWSLIAIVLILAAACLAFPFVRKEFIVLSSVAFFSFYLVYFYFVFFKKRMRKLKESFYTILESKIVNKREEYNRRERKARLKARDQDEILFRINDLTFGEVIEG